MKNNEWLGMPEYINQKRKDAEITATFKFRNKQDYEKFKELAKKHIYDNQKVFDGYQTKTKKQAWYPLLPKGSKYRWVDSAKPHNPRFPIYIVSKGRWQRNPTSRELMSMNVPFKMIVGKERLLVLPQEYKDNYDTFWDDDDERTGAGAARNFAWQHSIDNGYDWHWVMDDNIESFERLNKNLKVKCTSGTPFRIMEDFVLRYKNIGQAGLNYSFFCPAYDSRPPFITNTRIYSCLLQRNDLPFRWRGRYNEDTDLSLRIMEAGWVTVQFNCFLQGKRATQTVRGGNSKEFYDNEGTYNKSKMLEELQPKYAKVVWKFNRWHHQVDYSPFKKNKLIRKDDVDIALEESNNYGLELRGISEWQRHKR